MPDYRYYSPVPGITEEEAEFLGRIFLSRLVSHLDSCLEATVCDRFSHELPVASYYLKRHAAGDHGLIPQRSELLVWGYSPSSLLPAEVTASSFPIICGLHLDVTTDRERGYTFMHLSCEVHRRP